MKRPFIFSTLIFLVAFIGSCRKDGNNYEKTINDGFKLILNDAITYNSNNIEFYDFSSHLIYLKTGNSFSYSDFGTFSVQVDDIEVYEGQIYPGYSSYIPNGPIIHCAPTFYNDYIIPIGLYETVNTEEESVFDPRNDVRIINALKKYDQYQQGLASEILTVQKLSDNKVEIILQLTNQGSDNLLILDPEKMGAELFHYFTNGLIFTDSENNTYTHKLMIDEPEPWDMWSIGWLTL